MSSEIFKDDYQEILKALEIKDNLVPLDKILEFISFTMENSADETIYWLQPLVLLIQRFIERV